MLKSLMRSPALQKLSSAYDHLPRRDQRAVQLLAVALAIVVVIFLIWRPAHQYSEDAEARAKAAAEAAAWLEVNLEQARQLVSSGQNSPAQRVDDSRSLMSTVTVSAQEAGLSLQRFEPSGEDKMRIWLDNSAFDDVARWLETLAEQYGIVVDQAAIDRAGEPGRVNVRITLSS
ncbi:type II secretion system protein GspM [Hydrocarboniclastica marina]|uniref:Type II secretion system protein M n=1 Tax=Hydrocarboniclastica marina TaxID=2259620 RepID=A0A4P7XGF1_9ALTE|nr:type II secretion system protein M [Hydrocarboniclastica marina]MAL99329.1 general secretion pathway protein GspM [Alteromonadaceae bacterium]QCF26071.1 type II secretion system protein M [Hydrocarboniclastica marina]|tara:strand:- start:1592 stop:2113 length:522 start_codon:yes stop_codon:yes gene_type:complete